MLDSSLTLASGGYCATVVMAMVIMATIDYTHTGLPVVVVVVDCCLLCVGERLVVLGQHG